MEFSRGTSHEDRRRRVLTDEVLGGTGTTADKPPTRAEQSARAEGSKPTTKRSRAPLADEADALRRQPRITDFVPRGLLGHALLWLLGAATIAGLEVLHYFMPQWAEELGHGRIPALDLAGEGSISVWIASTFLSAAGLVALIVYSVRRHKADDYHGRYRIWLWAALCWFGMSLDECGSLHESIKDVAAVLAAQYLTIDPRWWWIGAYVVVLGVIGTRLAIDMRHCLLSTFTLLLSGGCLAAAVAARFGLLPAEIAVDHVMLKEGLELSGDLLLLTAMLLHARYVVLVAEGVLPDVAMAQASPAAAKKKPSRAKSKPAAGASDTTTSKRSDLDAVPAAKPGSVGAAISAATNRTTQAGGTQRRVDGQEPLDERRKLSKAERKAMRRQKDRHDSDDE